MSLQVWLPLNGSLENLGLSDINITNNGATVNDSGKIGKCYSFNGSNQYLSSVYNFYNQTFSVTAWIYTTSTSATQTICCDRTTVGYGFSIFLIGGKIRIDAGGNNLQWTTNYTYPANTWFHLAVTHDGTNVKYYINGIYQESKAQALNSSYWGTITSIGASQANGSTYGNYLNGKLNDFRIYNHCLSIKEIKELSKGLVLHYKLNDAVGFTDIIQNQNTYVVYNNFSGSGTTGTITNLSETFYGNVVRREVMTPNDTSLNSFKTSLGGHGVYGHRQTFLANTKYVFWIYYRPISHMNIRVGGTASNISGWTEIPPIAVGNGWYRVGQYRNGTVTSDKTDNIFTSFYTSTAESGVPITIDWASPHLLAGTTEIPLYDYPSTVIQDSSGYNHQASNNNVISDSDSPRYSQCMSFSGSSSYIKVLENKWMAQYAEEMTINLWAYAPNWSSVTNGGRIFSCTESGGFNIEGGTSGYWRFAIYVATNAAHTSHSYLSSVSSATSSMFYLADLSPGWHMFTIIYTTSGLTSFVDGVLHRNVDVTSYGVRYNTNARLFLGCEASTASPTSPYFNGKESDFRLYYTALTADDIKELYEILTSVDRNHNLYTREVIEI